jgi:putative two-component system response regulator
MTEKIIVVVDDAPFNLNICKRALKGLYTTHLLLSAENLFNLLERVTPDLILLDVDMPVINGYDTMRMLKENDAYKDIPVIFLSAMDDGQSEMEGLNLGAVDYIHKPFDSTLLAKRIEIHIKMDEMKKELEMLKKKQAGGV